MAIDLKTEFAKLQTHINNTKTYRAELEAKKPEDVTQEDRNRLSKMIEDGKAMRRSYDEASDLAELDAKFNQPGQQQERPAQERPEQERRGAKSWGNLFTESKALKERGASGNVGPIEAGALPLGTKAIFNTTDSAGGYAVVEQREADMIDLIRQRPRSILDLIDQSETTKDAVEYMTLATRVNNAAPTAEYDTGSSTFVAKPESNLTFGLQTALVRTIPTYVVASRQILEDAPRLRDTIDNELRYMVLEELEDQIINGNGSAPNFTGILNTAGIQTRIKSATTPSGRGQTTADTVHDTLRRAITDIELEFYEATGMVLYPGDTEKMELEKDTQGRYIMMYDPVLRRVWRTSVISTPAMTSGTALVGNFRIGATLWDRMQTIIRTADQHSDYFVRNAFVILAELRAAFGVKRPKAFEKVTGI